MQKALKCLRVKKKKKKKKDIYCIFRIIRRTPHQIWEENRGVSYSPNVAYLARYRISALKDVIKYFTTFFASKFFSLFSSSKT